MAWWVILLAVFFGVVVGVVGCLFFFAWYMRDLWG